MFIDGTPVLEVVFRNPFLLTSFPESDTVVAVIDTGYEGFVAVSGEVFKITLNVTVEDLRKDFEETIK